MCHRFLLRHYSFLPSFLQLFILSKHSTHLYHPQRKRRKRLKMINVFTISLVLTILITAGVVSPSDVNIKITVPPQETEQKAKTEPEDVKDKIKENGGFHRLNARELVCDAFGKCQHKIASALEGTKHSVSVKIHDAKEAFHEVASKVHEASDKVKEKGKEKAKDVADTTDTLKGDVERNASEDLELIEDKVKEDTHRLKQEGKRRFFSHVSAYIFSSKNFRSLMGMIHLLGFALSYGECVWVTFISSNILAKALPKQQFSVVQSKIYPVYFKTLSYGIAAAFLGHYLSQSSPYYENRTETIQGLIFLAIFSMTMFNSFYLEPRAAKVCIYFLCFSPANTVKFTTFLATTSKVVKFDFS